MRIFTGLLTAPAMLAVPAIVLLFWGHSPERGNEQVVVYGIIAIAVIAAALHIYFTPERRDTAACVIVVASALNAAAVIGVFLLVLFGGSCNEGDHGHVPPVSWVGAGVIYLVGATWALQHVWRPLWAVPVSVLAGGAWLVASATLLTGSTGACLS
jgi:hypothetical protein